MLYCIKLLINIIVYLNVYILFLYQTLCITCKNYIYG